jgi:ribosome-interacting GTPase 1
MKTTIGKMAKLYGLHRSTLYEAVQKGRVSASERDGKGQRLIDLAEMIRVYGEPPGSAPTPNPTLADIPPDTMQDLLAELRALRLEVAELRHTMLLIEHKPHQEQPQQTTADHSFLDDCADIFAGIRQRH